MDLSSDPQSRNCRDRYGSLHVGSMILARHRNRSSCFRSRKPALQIYGSSHIGSTAKTQIVMHRIHKAGIVEIRVVMSRIQPALQGYGSFSLGFSRHCKDTGRLVTDSAGAAEIRVVVYRICGAGIAEIRVIIPMHEALQSREM